MSEPLQSSQPGQTPGKQPSSRADDPAAAEESLRRKLLMGAALLLAMASIYAGVFNVGRLAQIVLAAGATMAVVLALTSGNRRRNS
jgi:Flp pilus assembly protein TadB